LNSSGFREHTLVVPKTKRKSSLDEKMFSSPFFTSNIYLPLFAIRVSFPRVTERNQTGTTTDPTFDGLSAGKYIKYVYHKRLAK